MIEMVDRMILDNCFWLLVRKKSSIQNQANRFYATWLCDMTLQITLNS